MEVIKLNERGPDGMAKSCLRTLSSLSPTMTSLTRPGVDEADGGRDDDDGAERLHLDHT